jgi:hypothetical protein
MGREGEGVEQLLELFAEEGAIVLGLILQGLVRECDEAQRADEVLVETG